MLNIYIGRENIPEDIEVVKDNEAYFIRNELKKDDITCLVLKEIDEAKLNDDIRVMDRFGVNIYPSMLSTSTKTLLNIHYNQDKVFNVCEVGQNAIELLVSCIDGNIYLDYPRVWELGEDIDCSRICINGKAVSMVEEVLEVL